jgi:hypothetical protein
VPDTAKFDWNYYVKPGATPTEDQLKLAEAIFALADKLSQFSTDPAAERMRQNLQDLFTATLVQGFSGGLDRYVAQVANRERSFFVTIVTPMHRALLKKPVLWSLAAFIGILVAANYVSATIGGVGGINVRPFAFVCAGVLLGRLFYYATAWGEVVASLEDYELSASISSSALLSVLFDLIIAVAACVAFVSGFIVVTIGAGQDGSGGLSTSAIATEALPAVVFGMIVGIAKTDFIARLRKSATHAAGGA